MLYFVATPIGNMQDMSFRAVETLKSVDVIACEDTRHSLKLLDFFGIKKQLIAYHKFNEKKASQNIVELLRQNKSVAVISDAGMPVISDPGNILCKTLIEENLPYTVIPGANAGLSALILSGLDASRFTFIGFLPEKNKDREELLSAYKQSEETLIFYSAPHDILKDIQTIYGVFGNRRASAVKEITKLHETAYHFNLQDGLQVEPKGEFVLVVEGAKKEQIEYGEEQIIKMIDDCVKDGLSKKDAVKKISQELKISKNQLYKYTVND